MSYLSQFMSGGGGKLRYQEFTANGTFTPPTQLLANGGQCLVQLVGGGGGGGGGTGSACTNGAGPGGGGGAGALLIRPVTVSAAVTVTIGPVAQAEPQESEPQTQPLVELAVAAHSERC